MKLYANAENKMNDLSDEKLIELYLSGNDEAFNVIYSRYKYMIRGCARSFFLTGGDNDDLLQEGMLGLLKAVRTFNGKSSFSSYAYTCVHSALLNAVKADNTTKHKPLNAAISIEDNPEDRLVIANPEELIIGKESELELKQKIAAALSTFEITVLKCFMEGLSYVEIGEKLNKTPKSIDNALQRIKRKIMQIV